MKYQEIARKLKDKQINIFSTYDFENIASLSKESAWAALGRYVKMGLIISPKRGLYYFTDSPPETYLLANKIYIPSYISFETALSYYSIIPEIVYTITCATTKTTREFNNGDVAFAYYKIKMQAFTGYVKKENYLIADPEKGLPLYPVCNVSKDAIQAAIHPKRTDYLYFVALGKKTLNDRLDTKKLDKSKILKYARLFDNQKLDKMVKNI